MAQVLYGYDNTGSIKLFDSDGDLIGTPNDKMRECVFVTFSRLLMKDEIKKGSFSLELGVNSAFDQTTTDPKPIMSKRIKLTDTGADTIYKINSPVGEYGILIADSTDSGANLENDTGLLSTGQKAGLLFYQAGVAVLTASLFTTASAGGILKDSINASILKSGGTTADGTMNHILASSSISASADALRTRMHNLSFNNTVELNSTIYFCRIKHNDFNYSSNPTYLSSSQIRVKNASTDTPIAYITSIGLYDDDNNLLAVGKLSEPLRKDPTIEYTLRARLDY